MSTCFSPSCDTMTGGWLQSCRQFRGRTANGPHTRCDYAEQVCVTRWGLCPLGKTLATPVLRLGLAALRASFQSQSQTCIWIQDPVAGTEASTGPVGTHGTCFLFLCHLNGTHPYCQQIIAMRIRAIPLILNALKEKPDYGFMALQEITGKNPVPAEARSTLTEMAEAWTRWGETHRHLMRVRNPRWFPGGWASAGARALGMDGSGPFTPTADSPGNAPRVLLLHAVFMLIDATEASVAPKQHVRQAYHGPRPRHPAPGTAGLQSGRSGADRKFGAQAAWDMQCATSLEVLVVAGRKMNPEDRDYTGSQRVIQWPTLRSASSSGIADVGPAGVDVPARNRAQHPCSALRVGI